MTYTHKEEKQNLVHFKRNKSKTINQAFRKFWKALTRKTNYTVNLKKTLYFKMD